MKLKPATYLDFLEIRYKTMATVDLEFRAENLREYLKKNRDPAVKRMFDKIVGEIAMRKFKNSGEFALIDELEKQTAKAMQRDLKRLKRRKLKGGMVKLEDSADKRLSKLVLKRMGIKP